jgi:hypothetical protein
LREQRKFAEGCWDPWTATPAEGLGVPRLSVGMKVISEGSCSSAPLPRNRVEVVYMPSHSQSRVVSARVPVQEARRLEHRADARDLTVNGYLSQLIQAELRKAPEVAKPQTPQAA